MTKEQVKEKTNKVIDTITENMRCHIDKALSCGAIDIDNYEDNFELPKIITYALLKDELLGMMLTSSMKKEGENLYNCL